MFPRVGITRIADVTGLDRLGIPVYQAIRPRSRNLAVSQGKAVTAVGAKVSGAMEAIELWHAESLDHLAPAPLPLREMRYANPIDEKSFHWRPDSLLLEAATLDWVSARSLTTGRTGWLPTQMIELDFTLPSRLTPNMFHLTSNGLASGNCRAEALVHGLSELVERHGLYLVYEHPARRRRVDEDSIEDPECLGLIERIRAAGAKLAIYDASWEVGLPCLIADLVLPDIPNIWRGSGCHLAREVALSRALTEAAQSRLTYIAGARDDLTQFTERFDFARPFDLFAPPPPETRFESVPDLATGDVAEDLAIIIERLAQYGFEPWAIDLTRNDIGIPVWRTFVAGLKEAPYG